MIHLLRPLPLIFFFFCIKTKTEKSKSVDGVLHGIKAIQVTPYYESDGKLRGYDTSIAEVYFYRSEILYKLPYISFTTIDGKNFDRKNLYNFILQKKGENSCVRFENLNPTKRVRTNDSLFRNSWIMSERISASFKESNANLQSIRNNRYTGLLTEKYILKSKMDSNYTSTFTLTFTDRLPWLHLKFTEDLDSAKKMRLVKAEVKSKTQFYKPFNRFLEGYTFMFEINELNIDSAREKKIMRFFN